MKWMLLLLLMCAGLARGKEKMSPIHLPVRQNEFVSVFMGSEPGRLVTLRIERNQNETIVLFQPPDEHTSRTFIRYGNGPEGRELVFIGAQSVWLPVQINPSLMRPDTRVQHEGTLGLGKGSDLWSNWSRFTVSSSDLILGENDRSLERKKFKVFELHVEGEQPIETEMQPALIGKKAVKGNKIKVFLDPSQPKTKLPSEFFYQMLNHSSFSSFVLRLPSHNNKRMADVEIRERGEIAFERSSHPDELVLGCNACNNFVWHTDRLLDRHIITPAYDLFDSGDSQPWFNVVASLVFIFQYYFWYAIAYTETAKPGNGQTLALSVLELYGYFSCALFLYIMDHGFEISRFVDYQVAKSMFCNYALFRFVILASIGLGLWLAITNYDTPRLLTARKVFYELALVGCFWLTQLETHYSGLQQLFLIVLASIYAIARSVSLLWCLCQPTRTYKTALIAGAVVVAHWFLICYNIIPFVERFWYGFASQWSSVLLVWLLCAGLSSLMIFSGLVSAELSNSLIALKIKK